MAGLVDSLTVPTAVLSRAARVADRFRAATGVAVDAEELLGGRAVLLGLRSHGRVSAGGATRLLAARDTWCALTLSRPDDVEAVPALVESDAAPPDPWPAVQSWVAGRDAAEATARARLLGLPAATLGETAAAPPRISPLGVRGQPRDFADMLVADLSPMWAGPLCGQLLARAGATVVKVESRRRPDGTRSGPPAFFDWMNHGKLSYAADFEQPTELRRLLEVADVVIEASRPGALSRHSLGPHDITGRSGRVWLRITGHGADADWAAFGDDAAVAGGLVGDGDGPVFCGDAIADPLTGLQAAESVAQSLARGGGELIDVAMSAVAAGYADLPGCDQTACRKAPPTTPRASALGADNPAVERLVRERRVTAC